MTPAMVIEELEEEDEIREVEGVLLNHHNFVVDADGTVQSPSKLTVLQMRVELAARSLMTEGNRRDIYKRIQVRNGLSIAVPLPVCMLPHPAGAPRGHSSSRGSTHRHADMQR